jgi:hypothetical protein
MISTIETEECNTFYNSDKYPAVNRPEYTVYTRGLSSPTPAINV